MSGDAAEVHPAGAVLDKHQGADPQRAAFLALWHDSQETRTTDLPHLTKSYVSAARNEVVTQDQVAPLPPPLAGMISAAALATPSAKQIAHEAITQNSLSWLERAKQAAAGDD